MKKDDLCEREPGSKMAKPLKWTTMATCTPLWPAVPASRGSTMKLFWYETKKPRKKQGGFEAWVAGLAKSPSKSTWTIHQKFRPPLQSARRLVVLLPSRVSTPQRRPWIVRRNASNNKAGRRRGTSHLGGGKRRTNHQPITHWKHDGTCTRRKRRSKKVARTCS